MVGCAFKRTSCLSEPIPKRGIKAKGRRASAWPSRGQALWCRSRRPQASNVDGAIKCTRSEVGAPVHGHALARLGFMADVC
jgi:hypothetical protein